MESNRRISALVLSVIAATSLPFEFASAQAAPPVSLPAAADSRPWGRTVRVTDPRLAEALGFLADASMTAANALTDIRGSRLPVTIGTREQIASLPEREGGLSPDEREKLLAMPAPTAAESGAAMAWVMFRAIESEDEESHRVARVWLAIEADTVESWIRQARFLDEELRIHQDFLAILAHEFVAHIGSIAATRKMGDLCDDPTPEQRLRSAAALARGGPEPADGDLSACALQVENQVRREINGVLTPRGIRLLPMRNNYSLEALNFEQARRRLFPELDQRLRRLKPIRR